MQYEQITENERYIIKTLLDDSKSIRTISTYLGRSASTISRELRRNSGLKGYRPRQANLLAEARQISKKRYTIFTPSVKKLLRKFIKMYWSPEQISAWLFKEGKLKISILSIYRFIRFDKSNGGSLWKFLRQSNKKRRKRKRGQSLAGVIKNRVSIDDRPLSAENKSEIGHWEVDTVIGAHHKGVLVTIVERVSKFTVIGKSKSKSADDVCDVIINLLRPFKKWVKTITADNGKEFANHEIFSEELVAKTYFAHPYASWERGLNENTNGLIRQFFPKGSDLRFARIRKIKDVVNLLNNRPRKTLGYLTPNELFLT